MKIIEQSVIGKTNEEKCEDGIIVTDDFVAVIDGSTSKAPFSFHHGITNGKLCMNVVKSYISSMPGDISMDRFCNLITGYINFMYKRYGANIGILEKEPTFRMTASAVIYSRVRSEIWMIGDCQCMINGELFENPKPYEEPIAEMRAGYNKLMLQLGKTKEELMEHDEGRDHIMPFLIKGCIYQNKTYSVIDGFSIPLDKVRVIPVPADSEVVLASDGYPFLKGTLNESEESLRHLVSEDPLCINEYQATKGLKPGNSSFDDRAYIRFKA